MSAPATTDEVVRWCSRLFRAATDSTDHRRTRQDLSLRRGSRAQRSLCLDPRTGPDPDPTRPGLLAPMPRYPSSASYAQTRLQLGVHQSPVHGFVDRLRACSHRRIVRMIQLQSVGNLSRRPELFQMVSRSARFIRLSDHTVGSRGRLPLDLLMIRLTVGLDLLADRRSAAVRITTTVAADRAAISSVGARRRSTCCRGLRCGRCARRTLAWRGRTK